MIPSAYRCISCGSRSDAWKPFCPDCGAGSLRDIALGAPAKRAAKTGTLESAPPLAGIRISTGVDGLDKVLGSSWRNPDIRGAHAPSVVLFAGSSGSGKSTLLLRLVQSIKLPDKRRGIQYLTSEQTLSELKDNAERLGLTRQDMAKVDAHETKYLRDVIAHMHRKNPHVVIVDSLNELSDPDNDTSDLQANLIRTADAFKRESEKYKRAIILVSHMNKKEEVAGVQRIQHIVSAVMLLTRDPAHEDRRILVCPKKNRFGPTNDKACFLMTKNGLIDMPDVTVEEKDFSGRARDA